MNKFWPFVLLLIFTASGLLYLESSAVTSGQINFKDLETECRRDGFSQMTLNEDRSLTFRGSFHVKNTDSELGHEYEQTSDSITLNVKADSSSAPETFTSGCRGSVFYHAQTDSLKPGRYNLKVMHKGNLRKNVILRVN